MHPNDVDYFVDICFLSNVFLLVFNDEKDTKKMYIAVQGKKFVFLNNTHSYHSTFTFLTSSVHIGVDSN